MRSMLVFIHYFVDEACMIRNYMYDCDKNRKHQNSSCLFTRIQFWEYKLIIENPQMWFF